MLKNILLAFIPIFVAVDALGLLPVFISFTRGLTAQEKKQIIGRSVITAIIVALGFLFLGKAVFSLLGITVADFMVAGGAVLFSIAIIDIISPHKERRMPTSEVGYVPLGTPLIAGPAVLTTSLIVSGEYGLFAALISIIINVLLAAAIFFFSANIVKIIGDAGAKAVSKITSLLLAAIAVMMIRKGIFLMR